MKVAMAAIADTANISQEGKLNITGIFDTIRAADFPIVHPSFVLAFRLCLEHEDGQQQHGVEVTLLDEDFNVMWGGSAEITVGQIPPGQFSHVNQVIQLVGTRFTKPGRHRFRIRDRNPESEPYDLVFQLVRFEQSGR